MKMDRLEDMHNIGKTVALQLRQVGIDKPENLKKAWLKIQEIDETVCIHRLYGLQGAIMAVKKIELDFEIKKDLKKFYEGHKL